MKSTFVSLLVCLLFTGMTSFSFFFEDTQDKQIVSFFENLRSVQQEKLYLHLDKPYYAAGEKIWFKGYLLNAATHTPDMPDNFIYIELLDRENKIVGRQKIKRKENGFMGSILLPSDIPAGEYTLRSYTNWMRNTDEAFFYQRNIPVANPLNKPDSVKTGRTAGGKEGDFSVSFFPEGGHLLVGQRQQIAFKCQKTNGYSGAVEGYIVNQTGDTLTQLRSEHDGMGTFFLLPEKGHFYYALVRSPGYKEKKIKLPHMESSGITLALNQSADKIRYQIKSEQAVDAGLSDSLYLIAHTRGLLRFLLPVSRTNGDGSIDPAYFPGGITHFLLLDRSGNCLSERLLFVYPEENTHWKVQTDKEKYERREKVKLDIRLENEEKSLVKGAFSVSITDNNSVEMDLSGDNIYSNLLLVSDLKGFIENPGWYFREKSRKTLRGLDLLMLTHGWSRFDVKPFTSKPYIPSFFVEKGQFISGRIKNFSGKEAKDAGIVVMNPANNIIRMLESDEKGCFLLDGIDYCDSTTFVIQARNKRGLAVVDIEMDKETIPQKQSKNLFPDSLLMFNRDYLFSAAEAGMQVVHLEDVVIEGKRTQSAREEAARVWADYSMTEKMLGNSVSRTAKDLFRHAMGGIDISEASPLVVLDGMCCWDDNYILETIYPDDMKSFDVYKDQKRCSYGSISKSGPAVVITLKPEAMSRRRKGLAMFSSQGYVPADDYYHPVYDTPEKKKTDKMDIRSTLYWNPVLEVDSAGHSCVEFYTSDMPSSYYIEVEGVDVSGRIYRYTGNLF